jgi:hypothetical protein
MKPTILTILLMALFYNTSGQIFATTSAGKKVILNVDDNTWKYVGDADNSSEKPCLVNYTGSITFKNNTSHDIYIYYVYDLAANTQRIKVKANDKKMINDLMQYASGVGSNTLQYVWKASLELYEGEHPLWEIQGTEDGNFTIEACKNKDISID